MPDAPDVAFLKMGGKTGSPLGERLGGQGGKSGGTLLRKLCLG